MVAGIDKGPSLLCGAFEEPEGRAKRKALMPSKKKQSAVKQSESPISKPQIPYRSIVFWDEAAFEFREGGLDFSMQEWRCIKDAAEKSNCTVERLIYNGLEKEIEASGIDISGWSGFKATPFEDNQPGLTVVMIPDNGSSSAERATINIHLSTEAKAQLAHYSNQIAIPGGTLARLALLSVLGSLEDCDVLQGFADQAREEILMKCAEHGIRPGIN